MKRSLIAIASAATLAAATLSAGTVLADPGHGQQLAHYAGPAGNAGNGWGPGRMAYGGGMMHPNMMGFMGGAGGPAMMGAGGAPCPGLAAASGANAEPLTLDDARSAVEKRLQWQGNDRLKVGTVTADGDTGFVAEIVTVDGSLVDKMAIDAKTGFMRPVR
jgi:hypothetical protein